MKQIVIKGDLLFSKEDLYQVFADGLALPEWHGHNLDALWDTLSVWSEPLQIIVEYQELLLAVLGQYGHNFLDLLDDVAAENINIIVQR